MIKQTQNKNLLWGYTEIQRAIQIMNQFTRTVSLHLGL